MLENVVFSTKIIPVSLYLSLERGLGVQEGAKEGNIASASASLQFLRLSPG